MNKQIIFPTHIIKTQFHSFLVNFSSTPSPNQSLPNLKSCIISLQACAKQTNLSRGKKLHSYMLINGFLTSPFSITSLINMYSKCNNMIDALAIFNSSMCEYNVFAYNAIISGFSFNEMPRCLIKFYWQMRMVGIMPDKFTFPCVINAFSDFGDGFNVKKMHGLLFKFGLELDLFVTSSMVRSYLKFGWMDDAYEVFEGLPSRDVVMWNAMINGYAQIRQLDKALECFQWMREEETAPSRFTITGILSVFAIRGDLENGKAIHGFAMRMGHSSGIAVSNSLIDMYGKCKCPNDALEIFRTMFVRDIYSWNSMIGVCAECGDHEGTLRLFYEMVRARIQPDEVTITTVLPVCSHLAALMQGREMHGYMITRGFLTNDSLAKDDMYINNAVMDMYSKCGNMREAQLVFDRMRYRDAASWNIMIMGYGMHGFGIEAIEIFSQMCEEAHLRPDEVTFVGLLSACSHAGLVNQGREYFLLMQSQYGFVPAIEHYTCVIDMLGRAGLLHEAYELLLNMPIQANPVVWRAFLAACRIHGNSTLAEVAARNVIDLDPQHCGSHVLMSNVYGAVGKFQEVSDVRYNMREQNVRKIPGCSWIKFGNQSVIFVTGDRTHPEDDLINAELKSLTMRLHEHGYVPDILNGAM